MILLGSTGSIGVNALNIAREFDIDVDVLVAGNNIELLNEQIAEFRPKRVVIANREDVGSVKHQNVESGVESILESIEQSNSNLVVNALVGFLGLKPTIKAQSLGKKIALANKESLVVAGRFIDTKNIIPIDSEHFGLWYLYSQKEIERLLITASGGAFRDMPLSKIKDAKASQALKHPNWSMGKKITIDSATMINKLFEILEAKWLFDTDRLDAFIETQSIIHALIEFRDGSTTAHIANADMRLPISYALLGEVKKRIVEHVDLCKIAKIEFREIEIERYPIWQIKDDILKNPQKGVVINAVNEIATEAFLRDEIPFSKIHNLVLWAYENIDVREDISLEDIYSLDTECRRRAKERLTP